MNFLGYIVYESLPFLYAAMSVFGFMNRDLSGLAGIGSVVLAICSFVVLQKRYEYRTYTNKNYSSR